MSPHIPTIPGLLPETPTPIVSGPITERGTQVIPMNAATAYAIYLAQTLQYIQLALLIFVSGLALVARLVITGAVMVAATAQPFVATLTRPLSLTCLATASI